MSYQATPFSGEWNEDPVIFLEWFMQCTIAMDDKTKARHFVYYLRAGSDADEWFEDLAEEERKSWVIVERLFRKRWLNEEEISTKESVTSGNEHQPASHSPLAPPVVAPTHETRPKTADFAQNRENVEKSYNFTPTTPTTPSSAICEHTDDILRAYASPQTPNDAFSDPSTFSTSASSPQDSQPPASIEHEKSVLLRAGSESQMPPESPALIHIATVLRTRSTLADFAKNYEKSPIFAQKAPEPIITGHSNYANDIDTSPASTTIVTGLKTRSAPSVFTKKVENSPIFSQNHTKSRILEHFYWEINTEPLTTPFILPTKHPCDPSSLYSAR